MTAPAPARTDGLPLQVRISSGLVLLAGLWLIASPWIFGVGFRRGALINDPIVGIVIALLAATRFLGEPATTWPSWATIPFGIWTLISPWMFGFDSESPALAHDSVALALLVMILSFWGALAGLEADERLHAPLG